MDWKPDKTRPLCPQICEHLCLLIAVGKLTPHERIWSVRETALSIGVNPNTVQRSYEMLQARGLIYSVPASGWYVSEDVAAAEEMLHRTVQQKTETYLAEMAALGQDIAAVKKLIEEWKI